MQFDLTEAGEQYLERTMEEVYDHWKELPPHRILELTLLNNLWENPTARGIDPPGNSLVSAKADLRGVTNDLWAVGLEPETSTVVRTLRGLLRRGYIKVVQETPIIPMSQETRNVGHWIKGTSMLDKLEKDNPTKYERGEE